MEEHNEERVRVGINGFGRIGRLLLRDAVTNPNIEIAMVSINKTFIRISTLYGLPFLLLF